MPTEALPARESIDPAAQPMTRRRAMAEALLIFAVFFVHGAAPVPEVNEPYYLGKAVHFCNPLEHFFTGNADVFKSQCHF